MHFIYKKYPETEVLEGSNAAEEGTVAAGDILRATSAMIPEMKYTQGNILFGGNGRPGFRRVLFMARLCLSLTPSLFFCF